jgi:hypothetical protein
MGAGAVGHALNKASGVAKLFGFDKPTNIAVTQPVYRTTMNNTASGKGMDTLNDLSLDPENKVSTDFVIKDGEDEMMLNHIARKPMFVDQFQFNSGNAPNALIKKYHVTPSWTPTYLQTDGTTYVCYPTPAYTVAEDFYYWRGGMNVLLWIVCPKIVNGKLRVAWHPTYSEVPVTYVDGGGDFISKVFDFNGETMVKFSVPYLRKELFATVNRPWVKNDQGENGAIAISVVMSAVAATTVVGDTEVSVNVAIGACKDMRFGMLRNPQVPQGTGQGAWIMGYNVPLSSTPIAQMGGTAFLDEIFAEDFPPLADATSGIYHNVTFGEEVTHLSNVLHRYVQGPAAVIASGASTPLAVESISDASALGYQPYSIFAKYYQYYLYRKGSMCYKAINCAYGGAPSQGGIVVIKAPGQLGTVIEEPWTTSNPLSHNGWIWEDSGYKPSVEWRIPYENQNPFVANAPAFPDEVNTTVSALTFFPNGSTSDALVRTFYSIGDDFRFAYLCGTPTICYGAVIGSNFKEGESPQRMRINVPKGREDDDELIESAKKALPEFRAPVVKDNNNRRGGKQPAGLSKRP